MSYTTLQDVDLLDALRNFLSEHDVARTPRVPGPKPPLWLEPALGIPAPGEGAEGVEIGADVVLGAFRVGGFPFERAGGPIIRRISVDLRMRARKPSYAFAVDGQLYHLLHDQQAWDMAGLTVIESLQVRELQRLGSDKSSFDYVTEYQFECYA